MSSPEQPRDVSLDLNRSTGVTVFQVRPARLVWTAGGQIQVIDRPPAGAEELVFSAGPQEIAKARYMASWGGGSHAYLTLATAASRVKVDLGGAAPSPRTDESTAQYQQRVLAEGLPSHTWWTDRLASYGVPARAWTFGKLYWLAVLIGLGSVALLVGHLRAARHILSAGTAKARESTRYPQPCHIDPGGSLVHARPGP